LSRANRPSDAAGEPVQRRDDHHARIDRLESIGGQFSNASHRSAAANAGGQRAAKRQSSSAARKVSKKSGRQLSPASQVGCATAGGGHFKDADQRSGAPAATPFDGHPSSESQRACAVEPQAADGATTSVATPAAPSARKRKKTAGQLGSANHAFAASSGGGHERNGYHSHDAAAETFDGHHADERHPQYAIEAGIAGAASDQVGQDKCENRVQSADLIASIRENYKLRVDYHRTEKALTLRIKAQCRRACGGDKEEASKVYDALMDIYAPPKRRALKQHPLAHIVFGGAHKLLAARSMIEETRMEYEHKIEELAARLPIAKFCATARGFGILSLAQIIGEAGDIGTYATKERLWKRMGMAVIGGERQQKKAGLAALEHGYAPQRRSLMWVIGDILIKAASPRYKDIYDKRKEYERAKAEAAGLKVLPAGDAFARKNPDKVRTVGHIHNRAKRFMEKALLEDLWKAWSRMAIHGAITEPTLPSSPRPNPVFAEAAE
jgi:hypothetical protein